MAEPLGQDADPQSLAALRYRLRVGRRARGPLAAIQAVGTRKHFQQQRVVEDLRGHGSGMVDGGVHPQNPRVGNEPMGGFHPHDPAVGRGNPDRAPLVAANRQVHFARSDQGSASRGGTPRHPRGVVGIANRPGVARVAASRRTEGLADGLAEDGCTRVEHSRHDRRVHRRHVSLENLGSVHHRNARQHDVVLEGDGLARQGPLDRSIDATSHVPRAQGVVLGPRMEPRGSGIANLRELVGQRVEFTHPL